MKTFTELYNKYITEGTFEVTEEATSQEFDKEVEEVKAKNAGKIRNKKIANADVLAVEVQKESEQLDEYEVIKIKKGGKDYYRDDEGNLTPANSKSGSVVSNYLQRRSGKQVHSTPKEKISPEELSRFNKYMDKYHKDFDKFKERYGDRAGHVIASLATKMAKKPVSEDVELEVEEVELIMIERTLTEPEKETREDVVKGMKDKSDYFKGKYGPRWKEVMFATATKIAKDK